MRPGASGALIARRRGAAPGCGRWLEPLAEDEQQIGDMVAFKLTNSGHQVVRVVDGETALAAAERDRPDVIILDVMIPLVDGFAVLGAWTISARSR